MTESMFVFVGTYTQPIRFGTGQILEGKGKGIYCYRLDMDNGSLNLVHMTENIDNPSYLTLDPTQKYLYAVNELKEFQGQACGAVSSFSVDKNTGELTFLNQKPTGGTDPCHVIVNDKNTHVFVSNFMSGSVCVFPIQAGGLLGDQSQFIQHQGSSINPKRQASPHAHSLIFDLENKFAFVPDLGIDKMMIYKTDFEKGVLETNTVPYYAGLPGAGPRHCVFHPNGYYCYLINELNCTITALKYDTFKGEFEEIHIVPTLVEKHDGDNSCADIQILPNGRYVYGSNRGHNSIVIYKIDQDNGRLTYVATESCGGKIPRNFAIDPTGKYMLVGNQDSDNVVVFAIDPELGTLKKISDTFVPTPVCIKPYIMRLTAYEEKG